MTKPQVNTTNAKSQEEIRALNQIVAEKICPFCGRDYLETEHKKPILIETEYWLVTENRWPYEGSKTHHLFIHKKHIEHLADLSQPAWQELQTLAVEVTKRFQIAGATLLMRFGDFRYTGGTVTHLHAQLVSGNPDQDKPVLARVG